MSTEKGKIKRSDRSSYINQVRQRVSETSTIIQNGTVDHANGSVSDYVDDVMDQLFYNNAALFIDGETNQIRHNIEIIFHVATINAGGKSNSELFVDNNRNYAAPTAKQKFCVLGIDKIGPENERVFYRGHFTKDDLIFEKPRNLNQTIQSIKEQIERRRSDYETKRIASNV